MPKGTITIKDGRLVTPFVVMPGTIVVENGIITYVGSGADVPSAEGPVLDAEGAYVTPGLIDIHVHGGGGGDVMDGTGKALEVMGQAFSRYGTTGFVPATVTASHRETLRAVEAVKAAAGKGTGGAQVLGIHLEGPYIDMGKRCANHPDHFRPPSLPEL